MLYYPHLPMDTHKTIFRRPSRESSPQTMMKKQEPASNAAGGSEGKRRRQVLTRAAEDELPGFGRTERIDVILETVYSFRAVTAPMIEALFFPPGPVIAGKQKTHSNCQRYLREL